LSYECDKGNFDERLDDVDGEANHTAVVSDENAADAFEAMTTYYFIAKGQSTLTSKSELASAINI
jgi:hypothetical protein